MGTHGDNLQLNNLKPTQANLTAPMSAGNAAVKLQDNRARSVIQQKQAYLIDNRPQSVIQKKQMEALTNQAPIPKKANNTGLPDKLKTGIESLSGHAMDDVKVHYNSAKPAQLNAHAYAQGSDIHIAPGQEKHLPHEAWHVVQQKQGRVKPTLQMKGKVNVNDDEGLEKEADVMGGKALVHSIQTPIQKIGIDISNESASEHAVYNSKGGHHSTLSTRPVDVIQRIVVPRPKDVKITAGGAGVWVIDKNFKNGGHVSFVAKPSVNSFDITDFHFTLKDKTTHFFWKEKSTGSNEFIFTGKHSVPNTIYEAVKKLGAKFGILIQAPVNITHQGQHSATSSIAASPVAASAASSIAAPRAAASAAASSGSLTPTRATTPVNSWDHSDSEEEKPKAESSKKSTTDSWE